MICIFTGTITMSNLKHVLHSVPLCHPLKLAMCYSLHTFVYTIYLTGPRSVSHKSSHVLDQKQSAGIGLELARVHIKKYAKI